jgi:hypothetical protein
MQGTATVTIAARQTKPMFNGTFTVQIGNLIQCDPTTLYPTGTLSISGISMNDSKLEGTCVSTLIEQLTSTGSTTPTVYLNGRCSLENSAGQIVPGYHYWIMFANNNLNPSTPTGTPDVISFLIFYNTGHRAAYGTGPVTSGHINVQMTGN